MSCRICGRSVLKGKAYCMRHDLAYSNLEEGYLKWRFALGVSWVEYLEKIGKVTGSGKWVKEVVNDILEAT